MKIALVMGRHRHHRTLAVPHEHVVADPHRNRLARQRVCGGYAGRHALLFHGGDIRLHDRSVLAFVNEGREFGVVLCGMRGQRMLGRDRAKGHAHDRVGAGGEYPELLFTSLSLRERDRG